MRKNRKTSKQMSVVATNTMRFGAIIVFFFVMVILNILSSSSCTQLLKAKGEKEREIVKLDDSRMRESTRWEEMTTPERIEVALRRHGLSMKPPRPEQTVRMMANGRPRPGQISVAKARLRNGEGSIGMARSAGRGGGPGAARSVRRTIRR